MLYLTAENWGVVYLESVSRWWNAMRADFWVTSTAWIDWVLRTLFADGINNLKGKEGLLQWSVKSKDAVLLVHAAWLLEKMQGLIGISCSIRIIEVVKACCWEKMVLVTCWVVSEELVRQIVSGFWVLGCSISVCRRLAFQCSIANEWVLQRRRNGVARVDLEVWGMVKWRDVGLWARRLSKNGMVGSASWIGMGDM